MEDDVALRLGRDLQRRLNRACKQLGRSRSDVIRDSLRRIKRSAAKDLADFPATDRSRANATSQAMYQTWCGQSVAVGAYVPWLGGWHSVPCRTTQVMRGR